MTGFRHARSDNLRAGEHRDRSALRRNERRRAIERRFGRVVRRFRIDIPAETERVRGASGAKKDRER
ncbi:MAG: hypothetical protein FJY73_00890 [Candidatus Eisenbacteria bacterium]|nr:hypothetical protein [Candidatus Eisenbacteria bacterium]